MEESPGLLSDMTALRDQLKIIADCYSMLCVYLREVSSLANLVRSDYENPRIPSKELIQRIEKWRSLEGDMSHAVRRHTSTDFTPYQHHESEYLKQLHASAERLPPKLDSSIILKSRRFKEGIIALKYAIEANRRSKSIAEFILEVKKATKRDCDDYTDNIIILHALVTWTKEVIRDCARYTTSSSEKYSSKESNGQILYTNKILRQLVEFVHTNTSLSKPSKGSNLNGLIEHMLDHYKVEETINTLSVDLKGSYITYYIYHLLDAMRDSPGEAGEKLRPMVTALSSSGIPSTIENPHHIYRVHDYFSVLCKSKELLGLIHDAQQGLIKTMSVSLTSDLYLKIERVITHDAIKTLDIRPLYIALRAAKFLEAPDKPLLGIWDKPPFVEVRKDTSKPCEP